MWIDVMGEKTHIKDELATKQHSFSFGQIFSVSRKYVVEVVCSRNSSGPSLTHCSVVHSAGLAFVERRSRRVVDEDFPLRFAFASRRG